MSSATLIPESVHEHFKDATNDNFFTAAFNIACAPWKEQGKEHQLLIEESASQEYLNLIQASLQRLEQPIKPIPLGVDKEPFLKREDSRLLPDANNRFKIVLEREVLEKIRSQVSKQPEDILFGVDPKWNHSPNSPNRSADLNYFTQEAKNEIVGALKSKGITHCVVDQRVEITDPPPEPDLVRKFLGLFSKPPTAATPASSTLLDIALTEGAQNKDMRDHRNNVAKVDALKAARAGAITGAIEDIMKPPLGTPQRHRVALTTGRLPSTPSSPNPSGKGSSPARG